MERRFIITVGVIIAFLIFSYPILAAATAPPVIIEKDDQGRPTIIVEQGKGKEGGLTRVTQIHYAKGGGNARAPKTDPCYKLAGWKWSTKLPIKYTINPNYALPADTIRNAITAADSEWDKATSKRLFAEPETGAYPWKIYDGKNSISFGNYDQSGVIAVTVTWYTTRTKEAVESDILFDTDFTWGDADATSQKVMDLQNIATHEIGHTLGLGDLYTSSCTAVTMYGYSGYDETAKRTVEQQDITGLQTIYGR